ncbi:MAG: oligosaccharide flippase family protein [Lutibacter sp.]|nr:oligosaccharide flippase family protein [Lutibacter sp.]
MKFLDKDSLWITFSNVIKLVFGFLVVPIIARNVAPEQLGKLDLLLAYGPFVNQFISMGLTNSSTKFYKENEDENVIKFMQHKIWIRASILVLIFFVLFSLFGASKMSIPILIVVLYSISLFLENISFLPQNHFLNTNDFQKYSVTSTISTIVRYSFTLLLVLIMTDKLIALSLGLLVSSLYLFLVNIKYHKSLLFSNYQENSLHLDLIMSIKKYSLPLFFLGMVGLLYQSSDRLLLAYFSPDNMVQIGYLGMAQRIIGLLTVGLSGLFTVWGVRAFENYSDDILMREKEKLIGMMLLVLIVIMMTMFFLKPYIIKYLLTEAYENSFPISILLIGTFVNNRVREILEKYFLKKGNSKLVASIFTYFGIFSVLISAFLLYLFDLQTMLIFRLLIASLHAITLFLFLRKAKQKINPMFMVLNVVLSIMIVVIMKLGML